MARKRERARDRKERLHREGVSGELDHASADVDQAEASIVAGADGEPTDVEEHALAQQAEQAGPVPADARDAGAPPAAGRGGGRFLNFLRASWAELQRVRWPDRRQVGQATAVVLGFVIIAGAFLGLIDAATERVVEFIL
jgi:preprotein translocase subunit SecE